MTRLDFVLRTMQGALAVVAELPTNEQDVAYRALLDHVRARRPESVGWLSQLPPPSTPIADPREVKS